MAAYKQVGEGDEGDQSPFYENTPQSKGCKYLCDPDQDDRTEEACNPEREELCQAMLAAVTVGKLGLVQSFIKEGVPLNCKGKLGRTALHIAVSKGHYGVAKLFIESGANVVEEDDFGETPLHLAVSRNSVNLASLLLDHGASTSHLSRADITPLHQGALQGHVATTATLIKRGADVNTKTKIRGLSPLHVAARGGDEDIVKMLLTHKADAFAQNKEGDTAMHVAVQNHRICVVELLLELVDSRHPSDDWFAMNCVPSCHPGRARRYKCKRGHPLVCLIGSNAQTALHDAANVGDLEISQLLIAHHADADARDADGNTPLHLAASAGYSSVAKELLQRGAMCNLYNNERQSPLHVAIMEEKAECIKALFHGGADPNLLDTTGWGEPPLHMACRRGKVGMARILIEHGAKVNMKSRACLLPLHEAVRKGNDDVVTMLLGYGAAPNETNCLGLTALHIACAQGQKKVVSILLQSGAKTKCNDSEDNTPLHMAALRGYGHIVDMLLRHGCAIDARTKNRATALFESLRAGHQKVACSLLSHGADANLGDFESTVVLLGYDSHAKLETFVTLINSGYSLKSLRNDLQECQKDAYSMINNSTIKTYLYHQVSNASSLQQICRLCIRSAIKQRESNVSLMWGIEKLPLPAASKNYLLLK